jgi:hypothetical protein
MVNGRWKIRSDGQKWQLSLAWATESRDILDSSELVIKGADIFLEFWIGDPDLYQRLGLRRAAAQ